LRVETKLYAYQKFEDEKTEKKCKSISKNVVRNSINFEDYKRCLFSEKQQMRTINISRSRNHVVFTQEVHKVAFSANDDKRIVCKDKIYTEALGYFEQNIG